MRIVGMEVYFYFSLLLLVVMGGGGVGTVPYCYDKVMDERVVGGRGRGELRFFFFFLEGKFVDCDRLGCGTMYCTHCNGHWDGILLFEPIQESVLLCCTYGLEYRYGMALTHSLWA